jgi:hypothetical protein
VTRAPHLALAAARGELLPLPDFLERAWEILREGDDGGEQSRPALMVLEGGAQRATGPRVRPDLHVVGSRRRFRAR